MIQHPKFRANIEVHFAEPDLLYAIEDLRLIIKLIGSAFCDVAKLILNENLTTDEIIEKLAPKYSLEYLCYVMLRLEQHNLIYDYGKKLEESVNVVISELSEVPFKAQEKIDQYLIHTISINALVGTADFEDALKSFGLNLSSDPDKANLIIVLLENYCCPRFNALAAQFVSEHKKILPLRIGVAESWAGPVLEQGGSCYDCLSNRIKMNSSSASLLSLDPTQKTLKSRNEVTHSLIKQGTMAWGATQVLKLLINEEKSDLNNHLLTFNFLFPKEEKHFLVSLVNCKTCKNNDGSAVNQPIILKSQKKQFTTDGGHRIMSPEETVNRLEKYISPIFGIVQCLKKLTSLNEQMHVYGSIYASNTPPCSLEHLDGSHDDTAAGKGKEDLQAKASCLCEAIERYCGKTYSKDDQIMASYQEIQAEALHPNSLQHFSLKQFQERDLINKNGLRYVYVSKPFDETSPIAWTKIWSLTEKKYKLIPTAYLSLGDKMAQLGSEQVLGNSNGCASGNTLEEAILQGLFELVERDQCALWWYSRFQIPELDLDTFKDPYVKMMQKAYQELNRDLWVLDLTLDLNIPTFVALSTLNGSAPLVGLGCHLDPDIALSRALSELNQGAIFENTDLIIQGNETYLYPKTSVPKKRREQFKDIYTDDIAEDILICQNLLEKRGLEVLVADLSHPGVDLKVVRVVVPGLRHFWQRLAPGRLYDVPFELGLVKKKLTEKELNPIPILF